MGAQGTVPSPFLHVETFHNKMGFFSEEGRGSLIRDVQIRRLSPPPIASNCKETLAALPWTANDIL